MRKWLHTQWEEHTAPRKVQDTKGTPSHKPLLGGVAVPGWGGLENSRLWGVGLA